MNVFQKVEVLVENQCRSKSNMFGYGIWSHHIVPVVSFAKILADKLHADAEVLQLAAFLHDYASIKNRDFHSDHHLHGANEARIILRDLHYPEDKTEHVAQCILAHRGSKRAEHLSLESSCLADADAMAHIAQIPSLLYFAYTQKELEIEEGAVWVKQKLQRSWDKLSPGAQLIVGKKYQSALDTLTC